MPELRRLRVFRRMGLLAVVLTLTSCASGAARPPPATQVPPVDDGVDVLGRGDLIEVKVFREPDLDGIFRVGAAGDIDFPLIGRVEVNGKLPEEVAETIRTRLSGDYLKDPQVTVLVREQKSRNVLVFGQVSRSGTFPFRTGMTIIEAITSAGGFAELAAPNRTRVTRVVKGQKQVFEVPAGDIGSGQATNFYLQPGDIIYVPEAIF